MEKTPFIFSLAESCDIPTALPHALLLTGGGRPHTLFPSFCPFLLLPKRERERERRNGEEEKRAQEGRKERTKRFLLRISSSSSSLLPSAASLFLPLIQNGRTTTTPWSLFFFAFGPPISKQGQNAIGTCFAKYIFMGNPTHPLEKRKHRTHDFTPYKTWYNGRPTDHLSLPPFPTLSFLPYFSYLLTNWGPGKEEGGGAASEGRRALRWILSPTHWTHVPFSPLSSHRHRIVVQGIIKKEGGKRRKHPIAHTHTGRRPPIIIPCTQVARFLVVLCGRTCVKNMDRGGACKNTRSLFYLLSTFFIACNNNVVL